MTKRGLVLSGGGAKGAYQAGMMKALLETDVQIDMIAGASIGALNGAILASASDLQTGVARLEKLWLRLPQIKVLQLDAASTFRSAVEIASYLTVLVSAGLRMNAPPVDLLKSALDFRSQIYKLAKKIGLKLPLDENGISIFSDAPLQQLLQEFLDMEQLQQGLPLYVSVYKPGKWVEEVSDLVTAQFLGIENKPSEFLHIQSLPPAQQKDALLASAALPLLFKPKYDEQGNRMTDGGQGGWIKAQGNTPVTPLVQAGCDPIIVSHLSNGSWWHRHDFPDAAFVEIRPNPELDMGMASMLDFSADHIDTLMQYGYEDTLKAVGKIQSALDTRAKMQNTNAELTDDSALQASERLMEEKMTLLKNRKRIAHDE